jgi:N-acetyltransferase
MDTSAPLRFTGRFVALDPLDVVHAATLAAVAGNGAGHGDGAQRETYAYAPVPQTEDEAAVMIAERLAFQAAGSWIPFVQRRLDDNQIVGTTNFLNLERWNGPTANPTSVEIGGTWLSPTAQRSPINTEAKLLLLTHAFETWGVVRVQLKTDKRNERSRAAIERIGATFEGVLRNFQPGQGDVGNGAPRNTAMFSLIATEWPAAKAKLLSRLSQ